MDKAIQKAIEGGWKMPIGFEGWSSDAATSIAVTDPLFWQSLGKACGWGSDGHNWDTSGTRCDYCSAQDGSDDPQPSTGAYGQCWKYHWHRFIDHLAEGKSADSFFEELFKN